MTPFRYDVYNGLLHGETMARATAWMAVLCTLAFGATAQEQTIEQRCADANRLIAAKDVAEARDAYVALHLDEPAAPCVATLRARLSEVRRKALPAYESGKRFEKANDLKMARRRYFEALRNDPSFTAAAAALVRLSAPGDAGDPFAKARRLSRLGLHDDALVALKEAVATTHEEVPHDLEYLAGGQFAWWRRIVRRLDAWARPAGEIGAVVFAALFGLWLLLTRFRAPRVDIEEFVDDDIDVDVGKSMTALLRDRALFFSENLLPRFGFVDGPSQTAVLPETISSSVPSSLSWIGWFPALLDAIHPRRVLTVCGTLHPAGERGAGVTVSMREGNRVLRTSTIWQRDFDPSMPPHKPQDPSGYHELAEPAAIWLLFRLAEVR